MDDTVYAFDPGAAPDAAFAPGRLPYVVAGNRGRLLDARRTPLTVAEVDAERGEFVVRIEAFEDRGAFWRLPLWEITRLQFASDSAMAPADEVVRLEQAVERYNLSLSLVADPNAVALTQRRIDEERLRAGRHLNGRIGGLDLAQAIRLRAGDERLFTALESFLAERDLIDLDREFTRAFVSNPAAGELVKGHAIVLAELGLCPFRGAIVRDPLLFAGNRSRARRAEHLIARMAFARQLVESVIAEPITLYRSVAVDGPFVARDPASLLSCTFSEQVAAAHFAGGPTTRTAALWRQVISPDRLVMTFLETREMSLRFREAEAVILADPGNLAF